MNELKSMSEVYTTKACLLSATKLLDQLFYFSENTLFQMHIFNYIFQEERSKKKERERKKERKRKR